MFFIAYAFKGQVHVFAGRVKIVSHSSCRTSAVFRYFCALIYTFVVDMLQKLVFSYTCTMVGYLFPQSPEINGLVPPGLTLAKNLL